jgi:hypothetical protein
MYATGTLHRAANRCGIVFGRMLDETRLEYMLRGFYKNGGRLTSNDIIVSGQKKERLYLGAYFFKIWPF